MDMHFRFPMAIAGLCAAFGMLPAATLAQQSPNPGYGPQGMCQQLTPEQQQQMCQNMQRGGYGPGMMGGYGPGYGMGYGMGPGMMGGYGPGYGMGYGMGPGMMGAFAGLDLTDAQSEQLEKIHGKLQENHRKLMPRIWEEQMKLEKLYSAEKRDPAAIGKAYDDLAKLQREALEDRIDAENKSLDLLSNEQKAQLRRGRRWGMMGF